MRLDELADATEVFVTSSIGGVRPVATCDVAGPWPTGPVTRTVAAALDAWAARCRGWDADGLDVFVYFDNDAKGRAPHDAMALIARLAE